MLNRIIQFFLKQKLITVLVLLVLITGGLITAPFNWHIPFLPRNPVPVDAIPDIGENQQIIFTEWMGRSPQDVENQITYPLTTSLLGMPGVKTIRSTSMYGFSSIYVVFDDEVDFYWARSRLLEKLSALPPDLLPQNVQPRLGPDATALGQVFWYTLEARDEHGRPAAGWDLHELRSIQDFYVRYALAGVPNVAEVASIGGYIKEYQVDLNPSSLKAWNISMMEVLEAVRSSNRESSAGTLEINQAEYFIRGLGYVKNISDVEEAVVRVVDNVPVRIKDIAHVTTGPADRSMRGILDKNGTETVGGVVIARFGSNPMEVIKEVRKKIEEISHGLPQKKLDDGTISKVIIVPFYDRTQLIQETLGTLYDALSTQMLITIVVIIVMVYNLRTSLLISAMLPFAVLVCFIFMKYFRVDANIVALSGIAIAIGTMVDLGIILSENFLQHLRQAPAGQSLMTTVFRSAAEVSSAIITAVSTTIISFLPVFALEAAEGKLFTPLAWTKTFALFSSLLFTLLFMPAFLQWTFAVNIGKGKIRLTLNYILLAAGLVILVFVLPWAGVVLMLLAINNLLVHHYPEKFSPYHERLTIFITVSGVAWLLSRHWVPLGASHSSLSNFIFTVFVIGFILGGFYLFIRIYPKLLQWCLANKIKFLILPVIIVLLGLVIWFGFDRLFGFVARGTHAAGLNLRTTFVWNKLTHAFPGMGKEFMPSLDEGAFLLMPTSMPHAGVTFNKNTLHQLDRLVKAIPEVETVVGKAGRAETAIDPAPLSMFENIIIYKPEYLTDEQGRKKRFKTDEEGNFIRDKQGNLIEDEDGQYFRQWRDHIRTPADIWSEIVKAARLPGITSAPKLQPIETRLVMLQTGLRATLGVKVFGPDLPTIEAFSRELEKYLKEVPSLKPEAIYADRSLGRPYLEIELNRQGMARYGLTLSEVQEYLEAAVGGMPVTTTVEGRERYHVRVRYAREWRDNPDAIAQIFIATPSGAQIPLKEIARLHYRPGPMMIRGENSFPVGYIMLDKKDGVAETDAVEQARRYLNEKIKTGELVVPAGVRFTFSGNYENQVRASQRLAFIIPLSLIIIFLVLYFQFRSVSTTLFIFSAVGLALAGGFIMLWLYGQSWFLNINLADLSLRELFNVHPYNLSVAVWVGFIALFGIATDDGVVMSTYLMQRFSSKQPETIDAVRQAVLEAGLRRLRPCLMTTATTLIALLPVLTSSGRGSDIMIPMAIPAFGGMSVALITLFVVPVLYAWKEERKISKS
ncbi:MAG: efflux RND transporter permease subunit [Cyclobacteriaceae bacterium]|nr:efflux RND transporter permease subunit [Cyclobacteriaceae bacterium]